MSRTITVLAALTLIGATGVAGAAGAGGATPAAKPDPTALEAQLAADPENTALLVATGRAWLTAVQAGDGSAFDKAEKRLDEALRRAPADPQVLVLHGSMLALKGRNALLPIMKMRYVNQGLEEMDRAVALAPDDISVRYQRGVYCLYLPDIFARAGTAVEDFTRLLAAAEQGSGGNVPGGVTEIKLNLAQAQLGAGKRAEARALLEGVIAASPASPAAERARDILARIEG